MTPTIQEIEECIMEQVAICKGVQPNELNTQFPLVEVIGLHGDDFTEISEFIHARYSVKPPYSSYFSGMSIKDWAGIIFDELQSKGAVRRTWHR